MCNPFLRTVIAGFLGQMKLLEKDMNLLVVLELLGDFLMDSTIYGVHHH